ncbi:MAG TPA: helix-turn-helix domain-containing protein, partial [Steroidobacteraceae bacterium]
MLTQEQAVEIQVLRRQGQSIRRIARELGVSRNTVRRYLREQRAVKYGPRDVRPCKLDAHKAHLQIRIEQARP